MTFDSLDQRSLDFSFHTSWFLPHLTYLTVSCFLFSVQISCLFVFITPSPSAWSWEAKCGDREKGGGTLTQITVKNKAFFLRLLSFSCSQSVWLGGEGGAVFTAVLAGLQSAAAQR